ncbi:hypothetical protein NE236_35005 [Actinoallomurus purpureus]|uniref:hypothetical protein n=1 Tax=Actinoallomurus purpureus TaxID=478114 RepID=UPI002092D5CD|nr:hypothetical protein [Actinoallomurus purpureus]MCO6010187.1 hypothetical protein [Actinoallomurus purpureus]
MYSEKQRRLLEQQQRRLLEQRYIVGEDLANDPTLLDDCPHRYVFVVVPARGMARGPLRGTLPLLLECVETLETRGWEPVAWDFDTPEKGVLMRRRGPGRS